MTTSKEVFAKRKSGELDEAYTLAMQLVNVQSPGEWDIKALGWCLVDLIKREARVSQSQYLSIYGQQLSALQISPSDNILTDQRH